MCYVIQLQHFLAHNNMQYSDAMLKSDGCSLPSCVCVQIQSASKATMVLAQCAGSNASLATL